jgi:hypothetical protein
VLADGRAIAIFALRPLSVVLAEGRAIAISARRPPSLVLADGRAIAIFALRPLSLVLAEHPWSGLGVVLGFGLGVVLGFGLGVVLGFGALRNSRHACLALGVFRHTAVVLGRLVLKSLGHLWHSPRTVDRLVGVVRIAALALTGGRSRLVHGLLQMYVSIISCHRSDGLYQLA